MTPVHSTALESNTESELFAYQMLLIRLGAFAGEPGSYTIHERARPIVQALHRVLAGGEVRIEVLDPGIDAMYERLEGELECFLDVVNEALDSEQPMLCIP